MTKSNNEYIPEVGVPCLYEGEEVEVTGVGKYGWLICRKGCLGEGYVSNQYLNKFSPTKTEAEKRRDEQIAFMNEVCLEFHRKRETGPSIGEVLYEAGWCKPKPLTDEEIMHLACARFQDTGIAIADVRDFAKAIEASIRGEG